MVAPSGDKKSIKILFDKNLYIYIYIYIYIWILRTSTRKRTGELETRPGREKTQPGRRVPADRELRRAQSVVRLPLHRRRRQDCVSQDKTQEEPASIEVLGSSGGPEEEGEKRQKKDITFLSDMKSHERERKRQKKNYI